MNKGYRFGLSTTVDYTVDIFTQLEIIAGANLDFISLGGNLGHGRFHDRYGFQEVRKTADRLGLSIESAHAPFGLEDDIAASDETTRKRSCERFLDFARTAAGYGIPLVILHPHYYLTGTRGNSLERASLSLEKILASLPDNLAVAIENLPREDGSWICARLLDRFDRSRLGFCYDSSHENFSGPPFHLLEKYYDRMITCHLSDNHGRSDEHLIPGDGIIDWERLSQYFEKVPNLKSILFEVGTGEKLVEPVEKFIMRAAQMARKIFN
nr:sugar phosphate isomerase/epimerase [candidate division Zixibacteria bacterium]